METIWKNLMKMIDTFKISLIFHVMVKSAIRQIKGYFINLEMNREGPYEKDDEIMTLAITLMRINVDDVISDEDMETFQMSISISPITSEFLIEAEEDEIFCIRKCE